MASRNLTRMGLGLPNPQDFRAQIDLDGDNARDRSDLGIPLLGWEKASRH